MALVLDDDLEPVGMERERHVDLLRGIDAIAVLDRVRSRLEHRDRDLHPALVVELHALADARRELIDERQQLEPARES